MSGRADDLVLLTAASEVDCGNLQIFEQLSAQNITTSDTCVRHPGVFQFTKGTSAKAAWLELSACEFDSQTHQIHHLFLFFAVPRRLSGKHGDTEREAARSKVALSSIDCSVS